MSPPSLAKKFNGEPIMPQIALASKDQFSDKA
jgi:hypothetical protein